MTLFTPAIVTILGVSTVLILTIGMWFPRYARERGLRRRVGSLTGGRQGLALDLGGRRVRSRAGRTGESRGKLDTRIDRSISNAGLDLSAGEILAAAGLLGAAAGAIGAVVIGPLALPFALVGGAAVPFLWLNWRARRLRNTFVRQMPDTVALLASAVRAGHSLTQALEQVSTEAMEPTRGALQQVAREIGLGASQDEALERLAQRFPSQDLDLMVTSIGVQQQVGGSLAVILDEMAETLRERDRINREIEVLTSPQRYSAYVLALLPVFVAASIYLISREYMQALFEGTMRFVAGFAALLALLGFLVMRKMAMIDV